MIRALRRLVIAPVVVVLTVLLWITLPLWLILARTTPAAADHVGRDPLPDL